MTAVGCGASRLLQHGGPVAVPFRACCAAAVVRAGGAEVDEPLCAPLACGVDARPGSGGAAEVMAVAAAVEP